LKGKVNRYNYNEFVALLSVNIGIQFEVNIYFGWEIPQVTTISVK